MFAVGRYATHKPPRKDGRAVASREQGTTRFERELTFPIGPIPKPLRMSWRA